MMTTTNNPPQTILTVSEFENLTSNYYLSNSSGNSYYSAVTLQRLPGVIYNVEINLNAMLNGRLYKRYPPDALQFNGVNGLTPQIEQQTLMQCLTECVEYKLLTQQYVNLNNNYSGNINGQNNYNTRNSNAIGLRQDIQAKLSVLGLYANIIVGDKKPNGLVNSIYNNYGNLDIAQLQQIGNYLQNTALQFSQPITFNGGINMANTINCNDLNATTVNASSINTNKLNFNQGNVDLEGVNLSLNYNDVKYNYPASMLNLATPGEASLVDWSFFATSNVTDDTATATVLNIVGGYYIPNAFMVNQTPNQVPLVVIKCHGHSTTGYVVSSLSKTTGFDSSTNEIDVNAMLTALYPNGIGSPFAISPQQLQDAGISLSTFTNIGNPQLVIDKIEAKINEIQISAGMPLQTTNIIIDPIFQGLCAIGTTVSYTNGSLTGNIVPILPKYAVGTVFCNPATFSQLNIEMDFYFTIVIPV